MTLNDFKALEGDRQMGVNSLPFTLGPRRAAQVACWVMAVPQAVVIALLFLWDRPLHAAGVAAVLLVQFWAMTVMFKDPKTQRPKDPKTQRPRRHGTTVRACCFMFLA